MTNMSSFDSLICAALSIQLIAQIFLITLNLRISVCNYRFQIDLNKLRKITGPTIDTINEKL